MEECLNGKLCCLECGKVVKYNKIHKESGIWICTSCKNIYLAELGILVCLPKKIEIKKPYLKFKKDYAQFFARNNFFCRAIDNIIRKLPVQRHLQWEDEDVEYWNSRYEKGTGALSSLRLHTREEYLFKDLRRKFQKDDCILEIGSGLAESVSQLFPPSNYPYTYLASDYSYKALVVLRRTFGKRGNVIYIQCLGNMLPFKEGSIDHVICLGVLHHMPKKEKHLTGIIKVLKSKGLLVLNEVYSRDYQLPRPIMRWVEHFIEPHHSAHEERVNWKRMKNILGKNGHMLVEHHEYSPTRTLLIRLFGTQIERSTVLTKFCIVLDEVTIKSLGRLWKLFDAGACLIVFQKK